MFLATQTLLFAGEAEDIERPAEKAVESTGDAEPGEGLAEEKAEPKDGCGLEVLLSPDAAAKKREGIAVRNSFRVRFQDVVSPFALLTTSTKPGGTLELEVVAPAPEATFEATAEGGELERLEARKWRWSAPKKKGNQCIKITRTGSDEVTCVNAFVEVPYGGEEELNGYPIGHYEELPLKNDPAYTRPDGFIEVTKENEDTWVSPHFQLRQFLSHQESGYPKYLVLRPRLLIKLEMLLAEMQEQGLPTDTFFIFSGYRTPHHNASIGNKTRYSRHAYGDAADIFIDRDRDGKIDDLNGDGKSDQGDARVMFAAVEKARKESWYEPFAGGLGLYEEKPHRTAFIHVDARGTPVNW